jgi:3-carboxy-cis,cis-muconate cycloisomerase
LLRNLEFTKGLFYAENVSLALIEKIGKAYAHELIEKFSKEAILKKVHLRDLLLLQPVIMEQLNHVQIERLFDAETAVGLCN